MSLATVLCCYLRPARLLDTEIDQEKGRHVSNQHDNKYAIYVKYDIFELEFSFINIELIKP